MDEAEGCALLKKHFSAAGYDITEHFPFDEQGVRFSVDGFDPERRVGYEYITTAAGDREEVTPHVLIALEKRMGAGELYILLVDEREVLRADDLAGAADRFLARVAEIRSGRS
jgi:hypothetical protein